MKTRCYGLSRYIVQAISLGLSGLGMIGSTAKALILTALIAAMLLGVACEKSVNNENRNLPLAGENHRPTIHKLVPANRNVASRGLTSIRCSASDEDNDSLSFAWTVSGGQIEGSDSVANWIAPEDSAEVTVTVVVSDDQGGADSATTNLRCHSNPSMAILVDAAHDGGVWWFPLWDGTGYSETTWHQGKALADYLRKQGYHVDELPRGAVVTDSLLSCYDRVIRAGICGTYSDSEISAYLTFLNRPTSLILISEFMRYGERDELAERLGIHFAGITFGNISRYAQHEITSGATSFYYGAGSVVMNAADNPDIECLGWLPQNAFVDFNDNGIKDDDEPTGMPVMGVLHHPTAKIFFLGEINGIETVPQPLVSNLVTWAFR